jgi:VanZ family protein
MLPEIPTFMNLLQPDKLIHIALFGVYAILLVGTLRLNYAGSRFYNNINEITLFSGILLAGISELIQRYMVWGRSGNIYDFVADCLGLALGIYLGIRIIQNLAPKY